MNPTKGFITQNEVNTFIDFNETPHIAYKLQSNKHNATQRNVIQHNKIYITLVDNVSYVTQYSQDSTERIVSQSNVTRCNVMYRDATYRIATQQRNVT